MSEVRGNQVAADDSRVPCTQAGETMTIPKVVPALARPDALARRAIVAGLAGTALGGALLPAVASKKSRKAVKRAKKQSKKKCRNQEAQCVQAFTDICTARFEEGAPACIADVAPCCAFLADCQMTSFFGCINT